MVGIAKLKVSRKEAVRDRRNIVPTKLKFEVRAHRSLRHREHNIFLPLCNLPFDDSQIILEHDADQFRQE